MKNLISMLVFTVFIFSGCSIKNEQKPIDKDILIKSVTPINQKDVISEVSIHDAVRINDLELVDFLIKEGVDVNAKDKYGYTPLHLASRFNHFEIVKVLLKNGAKVNTTDKYNDTPLLDSTRNGYTIVSKLLICNGAKRDIKDKFNMSPLHYATKTKDLEIANLLRAEDLQMYCSSKKEMDLITVYNYGVINDNTPKICGDVLDKDITNITLTLDENKTYLGKIRDNVWCAQITDTLENKDYIVKIVAKKGKFTDNEKTNFSVYVLKALYDSLKDEFANDFEKWNAQLDKDTLTFRFKDPKAMFENGSSNIKPRYKEILDEFAPRYIKLLKEHKNEIVKVSIQGHTSSRYRTAKTQEEKFEKNKILSEKRAQAVYEFIKNSKDSEISNSKLWIQSNFTPQGKSSEELILNEDGSENAQLSRRVEFRIKTLPKN